MTVKNGRGDIVAAINLLARRRANTADPNEQATIDDAREKLVGLLQDLNQAELLNAAGIVADASDQLERVIDSARTGPFGAFQFDIRAIVGRLQDSLGEMHAPERLPSAPLEQSDPPLATAGGVDAINSPNLPFAPSKSTMFPELRDEYVSYFESCTLRPECKIQHDFYVSRVIKSRARYEEVGNAIGNIPWVFIGIIHGMECGFSFSTHLHNGDPLLARTIHVPQGRPVKGQPPFNWSDSAKDALTMKGFDRENDWSVPHMLYRLEKYNGFGYRPLSMPTPYLWSFSNLYRSGKFVADHQFDPNAVSKQCGAAVILKTLVGTGQV